MKISTRGRYALRMMIDLAEHYGDEYISLKEITKRQNISKKYMEQIIPLLNRNQLLRTAKGQRGGYMLSRRPEDINIAEIVSCTEGNLHVVECLSTEPNLCDRYEDCRSIGIWEGLDKLIYDYLSSITLQDILDQNAAEIGTYVI